MKKPEGHKLWKSGHQRLTDGSGALFLRCECGASISIDDFTFNRIGEKGMLYFFDQAARDHLESVALQ